MVTGSSFGDELLREPVFSPICRRAEAVSRAAKPAKRTLDAAEHAATIADPVHDLTASGSRRTWPLKPPQEPPEGNDQGWLQVRWHRVYSTSGATRMAKKDQSLGIGGLIGLGVKALTEGKLATKRRAAGNHSGAAAALEKVVAAQRKLAEENPEFLPALARNLNNLGLQLRAVGDYSSALTAAREAVAIYRNLATVNPDLFLEELATSVGNVATPLAATGDRRAGLDALEETVSLRRQLAAKDPSALPGLATWLENLGTALAKMGDRERGLEAAREATSIRSRLNQQ